ncbi:unnamed protein product, partial [Timema podura]|nr:unnamed protein product [Timema podura]
MEANNQSVTKLIGEDNWEIWKSQIKTFWNLFLAPLIDSPNEAWSVLRDKRTTKHPVSSLDVFSIKCCSQYHSSSLTTYDRPCGVVVIAPAYESRGPGLSSRLVILPLRGMIPT